MTTDTAARVTRLVIQEQSMLTLLSIWNRRMPFQLIICTLERLEDIPFIDRPDIKLPANANADDAGRTDESVSMPFKYVSDSTTGAPVMPQVWCCTSRSG